MNGEFLAKHPKFANFIGEAGKVVGPILAVAGNIPGLQILGTVGNAIDKMEHLSAEQKQTAKDILKQEMADNNELDGLILADRADAREREIKIATSENAPLLNKIMLPVLALFVTFGFFGLLIYLVKWEVPTGNKEVLFSLVGVLGTVWVGITNYYFSSSLGSRNKEAQLTAMMNK